MSDTFLKSLTRSLTGGTPLATSSWNFAANSIVSVTGFLVNVATAAIGYSTGAGGAITQLTNRTTGVTLSTPTGQITTNNTTLAAEAAAVFTVTNTKVLIGDVIAVSIQSGSNGGNTKVTVNTVAAGSFVIQVANDNAAAGTAETGAIIINYAIIRAVAA